MKLSKPFYFVFGFMFALLLAFVHSPDASNKPREVSSELTKPIAPIKDVKAFADPNPFTQKLLAEYEVFIERAIRAGASPGAAVAIVKDSSIIYLKGFGLKQAGQPDSVNINTVFR